VDFDKEGVSRAFRTALQVSRAELFDAERGLPVSLADSIHTPYLGWMGQRYSGGTVLIGKNPGGGGDSQMAATGFDLRVERELKALRDAPSGEALQHLAQLTRTFHEQLPTIGMGVLLNRVLAATGETLDDVAFFNICPYRTRNDDSLSSATQRKSRELVAGPLLKALKPDTIIYLGVGAGREAAKTLNARWTYVLPRAINDKQLKAEAVPVLEQIKADTPARRVHREALTRG
jgi:hypothetical protein